QPASAEDVPVVAADHLDAIDELDGDDTPLEPVFATDAEFGPRPFDIALALRQPIARFEQPQAKLLSDLLPGLSELVGVPIRVDPSGNEPLANGLKTS